MKREAHVVPQSREPTNSPCLRFLGSSSFGFAGSDAVGVVGAVEERGFTPPTGFSLLVVRLIQFVNVDMVGAERKWGWIAQGRVKDLVTDIRPKPTAHLGAWERMPIICLVGGRTSIAVL